MNTRLDKYWDSFVENFIETLLADGYSEFDILDKFMTVFKNIRTKREDAEAAAVVKEAVEPVVEETPNYPGIVRRRTNVHSGFTHEYNPANLADKFEGAVVYVLGNKEASRAVLQRNTNPDNRLVGTVYRLLSTGEDMTEDGYLKTFNIHVPETKSGKSYLNRSRIRFVDNEYVSIDKVKKDSHLFKDLSAVKRYKPTNKERLYLNRWK